MAGGIHETEWMHYVESFDNPEDLGEMTAGDLQELISFLEKQMSYEILLLDFGQGLRDFLSFLGLCTSIYCPMKSGFYYDWPDGTFPQIPGKRAGGGHCRPDAGDKAPVFRRKDTCGNGCVPSVFVE